MAFWRTAPLPHPSRVSLSKFSVSPAKPLQASVHKPSAIRNRVTTRYNSLRIGSGARCPAACCVLSCGYTAPARAPWSYFRMAACRAFPEGSADWSTFATWHNRWRRQQSNAGLIAAPPRCLAYKRCLFLFFLLGPRSSNKRHYHRSDTKSW